MEERWLTWAKQLQSIASTGLFFSEDEYDRERFEQIGEIANSMLSDLGEVPVERIEGLVSDYAKGYATPKVDVRGAVIRNNRVLLVREATDGRWTLPGGFAEIGVSPAENVAKEILEEASIEVTVTSLYSVRHKARHPYDQDARDFYKLFFRCEQLGDTKPAPGPETSEAAFFGLSELPPLSTSRVLASDIEAAFSQRVTVFD